MARAQLPRGAHAWFQQGAPRIFQHHALPPPPTHTIPSPPTPITPDVDNGIALRHVALQLYFTMLEFSESASRLASSPQVLVLILHPSGGDVARVESLATLGAMAALRRGVDSFVAGETSADHARAMGLSSVNKCMAEKDVGVFDRVVRRMLQICCSLPGVADLRDVLPSDAPEVRRL